MSGPSPSTLYYGDCLDWMTRWDDASVDLIYLDPPFNSNQDYNLLYSAQEGETAQYQAFSDTWTWDEAAADRYDAIEGAVGKPIHSVITGLHTVLGPSGMLAYLSYMAERVLEMHRLLKPTGSLYLHCDPTASHYLKVILDAVFRQAHFNNEIVWRRTGSHNFADRYGPIHDTILFYCKSEQYKHNVRFTPYRRGHIDDYFKKSDSRGRYWTNSLTGSGVRNGDSGKPWRGFNPTLSSSHWAVPSKLVLAFGIDPELPQHAKLDALYEHNLIDLPKSGSRALPTYRQYLHDSPGQPIQDLWVYEPHTKGCLYNTEAAIDQDVRWMPKRDKKERLGYPTQKPLGLLDRIIQASSNPGDMVLDPFCGCGTTIEAAHRLNRQWAGVDISSFAVDLIREKRLKDRSIRAEGIPVDLASARKLARGKPFSFESWAVTRVPGFAPNTKQVADGGVDGRGTLDRKPDNHNSRLALAQVKGGAFSLSGLRDFIGVTNRDRAALGCFITLEPVNTLAARQETVNTGKIRVLGRPYPRMQIWPISDYFDNRMPSLPAMRDPYSGKPLQQQGMFSLFG